MLLRVLKTLLRASPWLLGLLFTMYLILIHGPRLAVDGHVPLAALVVRLLLCGALLLVACCWSGSGGVASSRPSRKRSPRQRCSTS